jgi:hypothetical protein
MPPLAQAEMQLLKVNRSGATPELRMLSSSDMARCASPHFSHASMQLLKVIASGATAQNEVGVGREG